MKKTVNWIILALACVVLIWGVVASCLMLSYLNPKSEEAYYARDGRRIVSYEVNEDQKYLYVEKTEPELITRTEYYKRRAKYEKILMRRAKDDYNSNKTDSNLSAYNQAMVSYKQALANSRSANASIFINSAAMFFGTYLPIVVLLGVALLVNTKIDYKRKKEEQPKL